MALYWLLGTSVRKIANFASSPFALHVKLERGKSKDVLLPLLEKKPQADEKIGACLENTLRKAMLKIGKMASTSTFTHNSLIVKHLENLLHD